MGKVLIGDEMTTGGVLVGPSEQETRWVYVTPALAQRWLMLNARNRPLRRQLVEKLKMELASGFWQDTHQGVAFNEHDVMIDGQHRCTAIAETGLPAWMQLTTKAKQPTATKIDGGGMRSLADQLYIAGVDGVTNSKVAAIKVATFGPLNKRSAGAYLAEEQAEALLSAWAPELSIAGQLDGQKMVGNRLTSGVVIRALLCGHDSIRIQEFVSVLKTGLPVQTVDSDYAAIILRNAFFERRVEACSNRDRGLDAYLKTEAALLAFIERRKISKLQALSAEAFPIPLARVPECCKVLFF